jgi:carboxymethylenebutenolidase
MKSQELFDAADRHLQAEYTGDLDATMATVGPDPDFYFAPVGLRIRGRVAVREFYREMFAAGLHHFESNMLGRWVGDERTVILQIDTVMNLTGKFLGVSFEGTRRVKIEQVAIIFVEDGLIAGERLYFDVASVYRQLGIERLPPLPGATAPH